MQLPQQSGNGLAVAFFHGVVGTEAEEDIDKGAASPIRRAKTLATEI